MTVLAQLATAPARAETILGVWERDSGLSRVRFVRCGDKYCAAVVWLKEPKLDAYNPDESQRDRSIMGKRIFFDVEPSEEGGWVGKAYNTDDGQVYGGRIKVNADQMFTTGCVIAGLVCTTVRWRRVR